MFPSWRSLLYWSPFAIWNRRRQAENMNPEEIIDLTQDDDDEPAPGSASNYRPRFNCPVCMSDLQRPVATICGHVFCYECLENSLATNLNCPLCKKEVGGFIRLYFN